MADNKGSKPKEYHKAIAKEYVKQGFNMSGALREISPHNKEITPGSLEIKAVRELGNDRFKYELREILKGIDEEEIKIKLTELLNAEHITDYKGDASLTGLPNYPERRKTLQMILELAGAFPQKEGVKDIKAEFKFKIKELNIEQLKGLLGKKDAQ